MMKKLLSLVFVALNFLFQNALTAQIAVAFDGTDDKIDCGNGSSVQVTGTGITLEAWIYPTQWKTNAYDGNVICKEDNSGNNGYMLRVGAGGKLNFALGDGSKAWSEITTGTLLSLNKWQHIAGTYDGSMMRVYIDGVAVDSSKVSISIGNASNVNLFVGAHSSYTRFYQGNIDEVRIWNVQRSEAELNASMSKEFCARNKNLKLYYKFNNGKPSGNNAVNKKVTDLTGNGNQGTLISFSLNGSVSNWVAGKSLTKDISYGKETVTRCNYYYSQSGRFKWTKSGNYSDTIFTFMECDSVLSVNLTIKYATANTIKVHECKSYTSPSGLYTWTKTGVYTDYLLNSVNCDSVLTIVLTIGGGYDTLHPKACNSYVSPGKKKVWTSSGWYNDTLVNYRGCDSVVTVDLTILKPTTFTQNVKTCKFYVGPGSKNVYSKTGSYKDTLTNYNGCDSVVTTNLTILESSSSIKVSSCSAYLSPSQKYTWTKSGTYHDTLPNVLGCDSFVTVDLKISTPTFGSYSATSCGPYLSPIHKRIWNSSGMFTDTTANANGCDSIIEVKLTVVKIDVAVVLNANVLTAVYTTGTYRWLNCDSNMKFIAGETNRSFAPKTNGNYAVEIKENGCSDTSVCYKVSGLNTHNVIAPQVIVYPNPSPGLVNIEWTQENKNVTITVYDVSGRTIKSVSMDQVEKITLPLNVPPGWYNITVKTNLGDSRNWVLIAP